MRNLGHISQAILVSRDEESRGIPYAVLIANNGLTLRLIIKHFDQSVK